MKTQGTQKWFYNLLVFSFFALPFNNIVSVLSIVVAFILFVVCLIRKELNFTFIPVLLLPIAFYFLHVIGVLYSENLPYAFDDLQIKLPLLALPLMFFFVDINKVSKACRWSFVFGCLMAIALNFLFAMRAYSSDGDVEHFFYIPFSSWMHPGYFTVEINLAVLIVVNSLTFKLNKIEFAKIICITILFICIGLLNSRMPIIVTYLSHLFYLAHRFYFRRSGPSVLYQNLLFLVLLSVVNIVILKSNNRFTQIAEYFENSSYIDEKLRKNELDSIEFNSTTLRIVLWQNAWQVIKEHPVAGVGTGDIKEELIAKYRINNFKPGLAERYSPHNQFLHTSVILGFMGSIMLLTMLVAPFIIYFRKGTSLFLAFLILITINLVTESMLERQAGNMFFAFFYALFIKESVKEKDS